MKNTKHACILICTLIQLILCSSIFCRPANTDSLLTLIASNKTDTTKLLNLNKLSGEYYNQGIYDSATYYAASALDLSDILLQQSQNPQTINIIKKSKAAAYSILGNIFDDQGNYPEALNNHQLALKISIETEDRKSAALSYNNIGNIYDVLGNYPEALKNHFSSLKICEALGEQKGIARSYNNFGIVYKEQGNYSEALKNLNAALKIREAMGNEKGLAFSYNNIGNVYIAQAENESDPLFRKNILDEALKSYSASLKIFQKLNDQRGMSAAYNNIGIIYKEQQNYNEALKNHFSAMQIREATGDKGSVASSYTNIGNVLTKQKKYIEAEKFLLKAIEVSKELGSREYLKHTYSALTELDTSRGNFKGALQHHKMFILYRDSLDNEETRKKTIQSQMTYDFEKKEAIAEAEHKKELENQQLLAEEKNRKQKIVLAFVAGGLLLVIAFAGFIFRSLRLTRKQKLLIEEQKDLVEQQKETVERQKHLVDEKQKEIIDSITYARRIQQSLLPSEKYIYRTLKRLHGD